MTFKFGLINSTPLILTVRVKTQGETFCRYGRSLIRISTKNESKIERQNGQLPLNTMAGGACVVISTELDIIGKGHCTIYLRWR